MSDQAIIPERIEIDGHVYVRESLPSDMHMVVLDRGFVFVGELDRASNDTWHLRRVYNVRKWETGGLGGLSCSAKASGATLDRHEAIEFKPSRCVYIARLPKGWIP